MLMKLLSVMMSNKADEGKDIKKYLPVFVVLSIAGAAFSAMISIIVILKVVLGVGLQSAIGLFLFFFFIIGGICIILHEEGKAKKIKKKDIKED